MKALRNLLIVVVVVGILIAVASYRHRVAVEKKKREDAAAAAAAIEAGRHPQHIRDFYVEDSKKSSDQLWTAYQGNDSIDRSEVMQLLAERKDPRLHEALRSTLETNQDWLPREEAAKLLGYYEDANDFAMLKKSATDSNHPDEAGKAASSLGRLHDKRALPVLQSLWGRTDDRVSRGAAQGLGLYGPEGLTILLKRLNKKEPYLGQQEEIAMGVAAAASANVPGALPALIDIALQHSSISARRATVEALSGRLEPEAQDAFRQILHDKDASVRSAAVEAIKPSDPRAAALLQTVLNDPDKNVQEKVGAALFQIDTPESGKLLDQAMADKDLGVVAAAYLHYLPVDDPAQIKIMADAMREDGGESMATALLNDSHAELSKAAHDWADAHNYQVIPQYRYVQH